MRLLPYARPRRRSVRLPALREGHWRLSVRPRRPGCASEERSLTPILLSLVLRIEGMPEEFSLLETMRLEDGQISRLERHLARMSGSARRFAFRWDEPAVRAAVAASQQMHGSGLWRLRLLLNRDGTPTVQCAAHANEPNR